MPIQTEIKGRLARITLARPPLNILDLDHLGQLVDAVSECQDESIAVVVLQAEGKCFSAGNDIADHAPDKAPQMLEAFHMAVRILLDLDAIVVADISGRRAWAAAANWSPAATSPTPHENAHFGQPEIDVGCFPPVATVLLPFRIGWTRAMELITTGRRIDAQTAADWGLITRVGTPPIDELLAKSPAVLRMAKQAMRPGGLEQAEEIYLDQLLKHPDCAEGVEAFLQKRKPRWQP